MFFFANISVERLARKSNQQVQHLLISFASIHHDLQDWYSGDYQIVRLLLLTTTPWRADNGGESAIVFLC